MKTQLSIQQKLIPFNLILVTYFFFNWILQFGEDTFMHMQLIVIMVLILASNGLFYVSKYKKSIRAYLNLRLLHLVFALYGIYLNVGHVFNAYFVILVFIVFEMYIVIPYEEKNLKKSVVLISFSAMIIASLLVTLDTPSVTLFVLNTGFVFVCIYFFYLIFDEFKYDLLSKLDLQTRLFKEAANTNEELRLSQNKFKLTHEELAKQKNELEIANTLLNKMTSEIYTQNELLRYISSVLDINELLEVVNDAILGTIGVDTCSLVLYNERNEEYLYNVKSNFPGNHLDQLIRCVEAGTLQPYFDSGKVHLNNRVILHDYTFIVNRPVGSIAIIPLIRDQITYGLLIAEHVNTDIFTDNNIQFFTGISTQITIAINNANIYAMVEDMAVKDGLTGIYNRKYLQDYLTATVSKEPHQSRGIAVSLIDIDKFKNINDSYGHLFGDEAIKLVASIVEKYAKKNRGLAVRYGGEEFVLVFVGMDVETCASTIRQLHEEIKSQTLECVDKNETVRLNVSIGISHYPSLAKTTEELLLRADNAMYYSKEHGRGKITVDSLDGLV